MFEVHPGFCADCGSILPSIDVTDFVSCYDCGKLYPIKEFRHVKSQYTINFNSIENIDIVKKNEKKTEESGGPVTERICRQCGHNQMSYATAQLRSADEGQTVFFTCLKCKFAESENS